MNDVVTNAIERVEAARLQQEWESTVRQAEAAFPKDWAIRVEPRGDEIVVQVRINVAHGRNPVEALKRAIDWYRGQARLIIPPTEGRK